MFLFDVIAKLFRSYVILQGGVIQIIIKWDCNLDYSEDDCIPEYKFRRLDSNEDVLSPGYNFRLVWHIQSNFDGLNIFGTKQLCSRRG